MSGSPKSGELVVDDSRGDSTYFLESHLDEFRVQNYRISVKDKISMFVVANRKIWIHRLKKTFPVVDWIYHYSWRNDLKYDISAGITIGAMQISQGLAYGVLASLDAASGLYVSIIPGLFYALFGSSRYVHIGTFAVISIMVALVLNSNIPINYATSHKNPSNSSEPMDTLYAKYVVSATLTCTVGILQLIMYILRAGVITKLLSPTVVNGFIFGVSIHVLSTQISSLIGISVPSSAIKFSVGVIVQRFIYIFSNITSASWITFIIGCISLIYLFIFQYFKQAIMKRIKFPFPSELFLIIFATVASSQLKLEEHYNVPVVGVVPTGFPKPVLPDFTLVGDIIVNALVIAIVTFAIDSSIAKDLASRKNQVVNSNQELLALGIANTFCSFFQCYVAGSSLARSVVAFNMATSQLYTIISAIFMSIVVLAAANLFYHLPKSILSAIIIIALIPIFMEARILRSLWQKSMLEFVLWIITALSVIFIGIDFGLLIGSGICLILNMFRFLRPFPSILGFLPKGNTIKDSKYYKVVDNADVSIVSYNNPLFYMNVDNFEEYFDELIRNVSLQYNRESDEEQNEEVIENQHTIILDFQSSFFIDLAGVNSLNKVIKFARLNKIDLVLSGANESVLRQLKDCQVLDVMIFPNINEATKYAK